MNDNDAAPAGVSFRRVSQRASLSFAQLRRVAVGDGSPEVDAAARALVVAMGLHAHEMAFGRGFALRSGAELRPESVSVTWLSASGDETIEFGDAEATRQLVDAAKDTASEALVPLDGWDREPLRLQPNLSLQQAIANTWPKLDD